MRAGPRRSIIWLAVLGLLPLAGIAVETPRALSLPPEDGFEAQGVFHDPLSSPPVVAGTAAPAFARAPNASFVGVLSGTVTFGPDHQASGGFTGHPAVFFGGGGNCLDVTVLAGRVTPLEPERAAELKVNYSIRQCAGGNQVDVPNVLVQIYRTGLMSAGPADSGNAYPTPSSVPTTSITTTSVTLPPTTLPPTTLPPVTLPVDPLHDGDLDLTLFGDAVSPCPSYVDPFTHCRDEGVLGNASMQLAATRPDDGTGRRHVVACTADQASGVQLRARQDAAQGRGFIGPSLHMVHIGSLFRDEDDDGAFEPDEITDVICRVRIDSGVFHRVGTLVFGSMRVDVHTTDDPSSDPFRHHYCVRFQASAIPTIFGGTIVNAHAQGRVADCDGPPDPLHELGRGMDDPEHG